MTARMHTTSVDRVPISLHVMFVLCSCRTALIHILQNARSCYDRGTVQPEWEDDARLYILCTSQLEVEVERTGAQNRQHA